MLKLTFLATSNTAKILAHVSYSPSAMTLNRIQYLNQTASQLLSVFVNVLDLSLYWTRDKSDIYLKQDKSCLKCFGIPLSINMSVILLIIL